MIFTRYKSAAMLLPIILFSLVIISCQKTQDEVNQTATEEVEVYGQTELPIELQELANQGDAESQHQLGKMYYEGKAVAKDYDKAFEWTQKAANQGLAEAQYQLGKLYEQSSDTEKAITVYRDGKVVAKKAKDRKTLGELTEALMILDADEEDW